MDHEAERVAQEMQEKYDKLEEYLDDTDDKMIVYVDGIGQGEQSIDSESLSNSYDIVLWDLFIQYFCECGQID